MYSGSNGLSFWLALAGGVLAFAVAMVVGHVGILLGAVTGALVFAVLLIVLGIAFGRNAAPAATAPSASPAAPPAAPQLAEPAPAPAAAPAPQAATAPAPTPEIPATAPAPAAPSAAETGTTGTGPETLASPRGGKADDLKVIEGIGPALEKMVNSLGIYHYDQIAAWSDDDVAWMDSHMKNFRGRIARDKWVAQARLIVAEGVPAFLERAKTNDY